ncbi:hypothetical protein JSY14_06160 [Brachybacterium sp. EF45031]|uniref:hypothetical protein n=1 Tax=Brachybacterium sillae TaxID=2810536 RepID=UPI00217ED089|nr:hypothetical protein [Brachybacterium sillae]MCS6711631.1 hypothetical protein [Brachybacterium sillae]
MLSPAFHDYDRAIAIGFERQGFDVVTHLYDVNATLRQKVRTKARYELPERLGRSTSAARAADASARSLQAIRDTAPDLVLVIKGDVLHADVWEELDRRRIPSVLWLYDELRRTRWADGTADVHHPGRVASYSPLDTEALRARGIDAVHVPLGFDDSLTIPTRPGWMPPASSVPVIPTGSSC